MQEPTMPQNDSGQPGAQLPDELRGWNWGAFLLTWIWAIGHRAWLGIPLALFLSFIGAIILGVVGNQWAWQNRRWESIEQFGQTQRIWAIWGLIILCVSVVVAIVVSALAAGAAVTSAGAY